MCGIIGYIGEQKAASLLIEGLKRLEYRGYDSSGIATIRHEPLGNHLMCTKRLGKIVELEGALATRPLQGTVGIGHTRWATHGEPSKRNSHPHVSLNAYIAVVHNGIIENHDALRKELVAQGFRFLSILLNANFPAAMEISNLLSGGRLCRYKAHMPSR